jgi:hypothetical protein
LSAVDSVDGVKMTDTDTTTTTAPADTGATSSTADAVDDGGSRAEIKALVKQRDELKAAARDAEKRAKAAADAEAKRLREAGDWEATAKKYEAELADYRPKLERLTQLEERETARLDVVRDELSKLSSKLPKALRDTLPQDLDPDAGLRMVRALHETVLSKPPAADPAAAPSTTRKRDVFSADTADLPALMREMPKDERRSLIDRLLTRGG